MDDREKHEKFIQEMLEKAEKKDKAKPQTRYDNVDEKEVEKNMKDIMEKLQKG